MSEGMEREPAGRRSVSASSYLAAEATPRCFETSAPHLAANLHGIQNLRTEWKKPATSTQYVTEQLVRLTVLFLLHPTDCHLQ